jgi:large subunit ribosomal protein L25
MAENPTVQAEPRGEFGTRRARRLRKTGKIPAVLSHKKDQPVNLWVNAREFERILHKKARIIELHHPAGKDKVFIREVQYDHVCEYPLHIDFTKVAKDELLTVDVPLILKGKPVGVTEEGGVLDQYIKELKVQCLPDAIPEKIEVEVGHLKKDQQLHVKEVQAPPGVKIVNDPELTLAAVTEHKVEEVVLAAAATPGPLEPEVIKKEKAEEVAEEGAEPKKKEEKKEANKKEEKKTEEKK